jgi:murein DD-endopeptidase MepM/ murein hydrolase activator NlpD
MSLCGFDRPTRLGWVSLARQLRKALGVLVLCSALLGWSQGCATSSSSHERVHVVKKGENLYRISKRYGVSVASVKRLNGIWDVTELQIGQRLRIPPSGKGSAWGSSSSSASNKKQPTSSYDKKVSFSWPIKGKVTSSYGRRNGRLHEGIDIQTQWGTEVQASAPGRVIYSGNGMRDYGNVVILRHEGAYTTVYAHNSKNLVKKGQFINRGQKIALVGKTGNVHAKLPILHFEVLVRKQPVDPMSYLR